MKEMLIIHGPDVIVVTKTKVDMASTGNFFERNGFTGKAFSGPRGRSGGCHGTLLKST